MKILLTGGTGLVGKALGIRLAQEKYEIRLLARNPERARAGLTYPCEIFPWDGENDIPPPKALKGVDVVIHLAGENIADQRWTSARKKQLIQSRVEAARLLGQGLKDAGVKPKLFLSASGVGYYGDRGEEILDESSERGADFLADLCRDWEEAADLVPAQRTVKLRLGVVLSPYGGFLSQVVPLFQRLGASRLGSGKHFFSWIHIDDLVEAIMQTLDSERLSGAINLVAPQPVTNAELTAELAEAIKVFQAPPVPAVALRLRYGELAQMLLGSQRVIPGVLKAAGFQFKYPDLTKALRAIYPEDLQSGETILKFAQWIPKPVAEVWPFFTSERNLEKITPPMLNFHVLGKSTEEIQKGTLIDYRLKLRGIPLKWQTLISRWEPGQVFVDEQLKGPYEKWHHTHEFEPLAQGTLMLDTVRLRLPLGLLGRGVALGQVLSDVNGIFAYRGKVIAEEFYPPQALPNS